MKLYKVFQVEIMLITKKNIESTYMSTDSSPHCGIAVEP